MRCVPKQGQKAPLTVWGAEAPAMPQPLRGLSLPGVFRYLRPRYVVASAYPAIRVHPAVLAHESPQTANRGNVAARDQA
jgi:hypothetical protein